MVPRPGSGRYPDPGFSTIPPRTALFRCPSEKQAAHRVSESWNQVVKSLQAMALLQRAQNYQGGAALA